MMSSLSQLTEEKIQSWITDGFAQYTDLAGFGI